MRTKIEIENKYNILTLEFDFKKYSIQQLLNINSYVQKESEYTTDFMYEVERVQDIDCFDSLIIKDTKVDSTSTCLTKIFQYRDTRLTAVITDIITAFMKEL
jgi:hypothetical protein